MNILTNHFTPFLENIVKKILIPLLLSSSFLFSTTAWAESNFCQKYDCTGFAENIIRQDSRSWFFNRYDYNSATLDKSSIWQSPSGIKVTYKVNYTYNGGRSGWAELTFNDGEFVCIRYWDFPSDCRSGPKR